MILEDGSTSERQAVAVDFPVRVGQVFVVDARRWVVVAEDDREGGQKD